MSFEQEKQDFINELKAGNIDHFDVIDDLKLGTNFTDVIQYRNDFEVMSLILEIIFYEQRSNFANLIEDIFFRSDPQLRKNKKYLLLALKFNMRVDKKSGYFMFWQPIIDAYINDPEVMSYLVGSLIEYERLPEEVQNNKEVAFKFLKKSNNQASFNKLPISLRTDENFIKTLIKESIKIDFKNTLPIETFLKEVDLKKTLLDITNPQFKEYFELLPSSFKDNKTFIESILRSPNESLIFAILPHIGMSLKSDKEFVLEILRDPENKEVFSTFYQSLPPITFYDKEVLLLVAKKSPQDLKLVDKMDSSVATMIVQKNGLALEYLSLKIRKDKNVVREAIKQNPLALKFTDKNLKLDKDLVKEAFMLNSESFEFAGDSVKEDKEFIKELYAINPIVLDYVPLATKKEYLLKEEGILIEEEEIYYAKTKTKILQEAVKIKYNSLTLLFLSDLKFNDLILLKKYLYASLNLIENSPLHGFKNIILNKTLYFLDTATFKLFTGETFKISGRWNAFFENKSKRIYFIIDQDGSMRGVESAVTTIIHEFAHQFHNTKIKNGYFNTEFYDLYKMATSKTDCTLAQLPKIGDLLSELNYDQSRRKWWWTVTSSNEDFVLTKIIKNEYIYEDGEGHKVVLDKSDLLKMIKCPSQYGSSDVYEFFAEMTTLITANKVKPNQRAIADKFLEIVARNYQP